MHHNSTKENLSHSSILAASEGFGLAVGGFVLGGGLEALTNVLLARFLGPYQFGLFSLGYNLMIGASVVAMAGMRDSLGCYIPYYQADQNGGAVCGTFQVALFSVLASSVLVGGVIFLGSHRLGSALFHRKDLANILQAFAVLLLFYTLSQFLIAVLRSFRSIGKMVVVREIWGKGSRVLLLLALFVFGMHLGGAVTGFLASYLVAITAGVWYVRKFLTPGGTFIQRPWKQLLKFAWPLLCYDFAIAFWTKSTLIIMALFLAPEKVGLYAAANSIAIVLSIPLRGLVIIFVPLASSYFGAKQNQQVMALYRTSTRWLLYSSLPAFVVLFMWPDVILKLMFGPAYAGMSSVLRVLLLANLVVAVGSLWSEIDVVVGRASQNVLLVLGSTAISVLLLIVLVPRMGPMGAALATVLSLVSICIGGTALVGVQWKVFPLELRGVQFFIISAAFAAVAFIAVIAVGNVFEATANLRFAVFTAIYLPGSLGLVLFFMKTDAEDKIMLNALRTKLNLTANMR